MGFRGPIVPDWLKSFSEKFGLGGVILFDFDAQQKKYENNIICREQLSELTAQLQDLASPPLIFVDQEGGKVRRLKESLGFCPLPSQKRMAELTTSELKKNATAAFAEMRELGFHFNLAPVIDLDINPDNPDIGRLERSFSAAPETVRKLVDVLNTVAIDCNLGLCLKHYPGLGGARTNSHEEITEIETDSAQLELFDELSKTLHGGAVLVSHGIVESWQPGVPASLSEVAIGKLLKNCPDSLIITDDIQMQGLQRKYSSLEAIEKGILAGANLICIGNNMMNEEDSMHSFAERLTAQAKTHADLDQAVQISLQKVQERKLKFLPG